MRHSRYARRSFGSINPTPILPSMDDGSDLADLPEIRREVLVRQLGEVQGRLAAAEQQTAALRAVAPAVPAATPKLIALRLRAAQLTLAIQQLDAAATTGA